MELNFLTKETVTRADLVPSSRNIYALGTLYHSLVGRFRLVAKATDGQAFSRG